MVVKTVTVTTEDVGTKTVLVGDDSLDGPLSLRLVPGPTGGPKTETLVSTLLFRSSIPRQV